jgi:putative transposase
MKFAFVAKHRAIWPVVLLGKALDVLTPGFHDWVNRAPAKRTLENESLLGLIRGSFHDSDRTYGARRVWRDVLAEGVSCGLHRIERLMQQNALKARPRRSKLPSDTGLWVLHAIAPNVLDRQFYTAQPNRKWIADFTYIWTAEGWLYVAAVIDLF